MSEYRRARIMGGTYFFTVVTRSRVPVFVEAGSVDILRGAIRRVMARRPFHLQAIVVLPDHLHCIWRLPENDDDFPGRWREIKKAVSRAVAPASNRRGERPVWQRRFWEHLIRDDDDWRRHVDYIHYNPVKHGLVAKASDWPYSSLRRFVERGLYPADWGCSSPESIGKMDLE